LPPVKVIKGGPSLPTDEMLFDSDRTGNYEIFRMSDSGTGPAQLTHDARYDSWWPRLSPDRTRVLFYRTPRGTHDRDFTKTSLWEMASDGSSVTELLPAAAYGWWLQGHVEWSPDEQHLVMFGGSRTNSQIFVTDANGRNPRQLTHRGGISVDPSWSPDGQSILFIGCPHSICLPHDQEVFRVPMSGGDAIRLTHDGVRDQDPYYSPNGRTLSWLSEVSSRGAQGTWDIRFMPADGTDPRRLINDENVNSVPRWTPDGQHIMFHRLVYGQGSDFEIWSIRPDGTGLTELTAGQPGSNEYPSP
jgi:Tol biopolymer transport system component